MDTFQHILHFSLAGLFQEMQAIASKLGKLDGDFWNSNGSKPLTAHLLLKNLLSTAVAGCGFLVCVK